MFCLFFASHYSARGSKLFYFVCNSFPLRENVNGRLNEPVLHLKAGNRAEEEVEQLGEGESEEEDSEGEESDGVSAVDLVKPFM